MTSWHDFNRKEMTQTHRITLTNCGLLHTKTIKSWIFKSKNNMWLNRLFSPCSWTLSSWPWSWRRRGGRRGPRSPSCPARRGRTPPPPRTAWSRAAGSGGGTGRRSTGSEKRGKWDIVSKKLRAQLGQVPSVARYPEELLGCHTIDG